MHKRVTQALLKSSKAWLRYETANMPNKLNHKSQLQAEVCEEIKEIEKMTAR